MIRSCLTSVPVHKNFFLSPGSCSTMAAIQQQRTVLVTSPAMILKFRNSHENLLPLLPPIFSLRFIFQLCLYSCNVYTAANIVWTEKTKVEQIKLKAIKFIILFFSCVLNLLGLSSYSVIFLLKIIQCVISFYLGSSSSSSRRAAFLSPPECPTFPVTQLATKSE